MSLSPLPFPQLARFLALLPACLVVVLMFSTPAHSAPSAGIEEVMQQPNGAQFIAIQRGDEWSSWLETESGFAIAQAPDGFWRYVEAYSGAVPVMSAVLADQTPPPTLDSAVQPQLSRIDLMRTEGSPLDLSSASSVTPDMAPNGNFTGKVLYILAEFDDQAGRTFESLWSTSLTNDLADYYDKASFGKVSILPAEESFGTANNGVIGWINIGPTHPNTNRNTGPDNYNLTRAAINAADPYIDYSAFDSNNNGLVDSNELAVVVVVAGYEAAFTASPSPSIWAHRWSIPGGVSVDGVTVGHYNSSLGFGGYAQFGEFHGSHRATVGIQVHELAHLIFDLPDLYDIDGSSRGIGGFGVMSTGSWGRNATDLYLGETPVLPSAWSLMEREWANVLEGDGEVAITASGAAGSGGDGVVYRASTNSPEQYFLVQNRSNAGYDTGLGRFLGYNFVGGLNVFHIDDSRGTNANDLQRLVDVEEADGTSMQGSDYGSSSDLYRFGNVTEFGNATNPSSRLHDGRNTGVLINGISGPASVMTATFSSELSRPTAAFSAVTSSSSRSVDFDGNASTDSDGVIVSYEWKFGDGATGSGVTPNHLYSVDGIYSVELRVTDNDGASSSIIQDVSVDTGGSVVVVALDLFDIDRATGTKYQNQVTLPANAIDLRFEMSGGGGEADLYVREGAKPTRAVYDCRPFNTGNSESCTFTAPVSSATYYFNIRARSPGYAGVDIKVSYSTGTSANEPPLAAFTSSAQASPREFSFDASTSSDPDGLIALYEWDFGDGTTDGGLMPVHTFAEDGTYSVELTVTDGNGASDSTSQDVVVTTATGGQVVVALEEFNIARILKAKYRNSITVPVGATDLRFSITGGSGEADLYVREGAQPTQAVYDCRPYLAGNDEECVVATPDASSVYHLTIRARAAFTGVSIRVTYSIGGGNDNLLPTAAFTSTPLSTPRALDFDGSASSDPDGSIVTYAWDFGDGSAGSGVMPKHTYAIDGTYVVELTVTDDDGAASSTTQSIIVTTPGEGELIVAFEEFDIAREFQGKYSGEVVLPAGASDLRITISGGTGSGGAADLYVREGDRRPTLSVYDCRPYLNGNDEECVFVSPVPSGRYNFTIRARRAFAGLTVRVTYRLSSGTN